MLGGTFDHLHLGHERMLDAAFDGAERVTVAVTSPHMLTRKYLGELIQPLDQRCANVEKYCLDRGVLERANIVELHEALEPGSSDASYDMIVVSPETEPAVREINENRARNEIRPLEIVVIEPYQLDDGTLISSSRIRRGELDPAGNRFYDDAMMEKTWKMSPGAIPLLKAGIGDLEFGGEDDRTQLDCMRRVLEKVEEQKMIAVGDVVTLRALELESTPWIAVVDRVTKREALFEDFSFFEGKFDHEILLQNPQGLVSQALLGAFRTATDRFEQTTLIKVEGEEDLAGLPAMIFAPLETRVIYGVPWEGVMIVTCGLERKTFAREVFDMFEVAEHDDE